MVATYESGKARMGAKRKGGNADCDWRSGGGRA